MAVKIPSAPGCTRQNLARGRVGRSPYLEGVYGSVSTGQGNKVAGHAHDNDAEDNLDDPQGHEGRLHRHDRVSAGRHC